ncbi:uncharacterized protein BO80DRAFT_466953 [Aspergillus ibericus CBS 121593]|uniref:Uncharacterized protein n=1 Tax=Aspergillus ibericus CBS 121593 TaxID=1448316 RepID=A0A395GWU6_9EURO|nr:hypothetical protein BO80DRAFT_466953 [Aspergillus ibericus CBS 121593]RAK98523.1 hypothetical protein BO80DRAFT_466953 [Aspergillus ibericus CBS 121593]
MAMRAFSSTAGQLKQLNWSLYGTTIDVNWLIQQIERSIDEVPGLRARVVSAQVIGNPHPTPNRNDPYHGSVVLLDKEGKRVTSAHAYLNGYVKFSRETAFKPVKLPPIPGAPVFPPEGIETVKSSSPSGSNQSTSKTGKK